MNYVDILLIAVIVISILIGIARGFIRGMLALAVWLGSIIIGFRAYPYINAFLERNTQVLSIWTLPISFIVAIIIARLVLGLIASLIIRATPYDVHASGGNKLLGIIPGLINGVIWAGLLATVLLILPVSDQLSVSARNSSISAKLTAPAIWVEELLSPVFNEALKRFVTNTTVEPGSEQFTRLPYVVPQPKERAELETEMLNMVNNERISHHLQPLVADPEEAAVARQHSTDMFQRGYFSHVTPDGVNPFDRMKRANVGYQSAGENLVLAPTLSMAHSGLMNSPGHRANILNPSFGRVGIAVMDGGIMGLMITQDFRN